MYLGMTINVKEIIADGLLQLHKENSVRNYYDKTSVMEGKQPVILEIYKKYGLCE